MISRIYVTPKDIRKAGTVINSYLLEHDLGKNALVEVAEALTNPIIETFSINKPPRIGSFKYAIEIGYKPGVTDNVAHTVKEMITDLLRSKASKLEVYSSKIFLMKNNDASSLYNPLIERAHILTGRDFTKKGLPLEALKVILEKRTLVTKVNLDVSDDELIKIGKPLALDLPSMKAIQEYFKKIKRDPTDIEIECLAQTWSEHCKHTIFANPIDKIKDGLYKTYIKGATNLIRKQKGKNDFCVSVFSDNAGGIVFDKDYLISHKVETHNSPSALDPFGGAITGIVGVNRDAMGFGLGSKPVANTYGFCFSHPSDKRKLFKDKNLTEQLLPASRIMEGVIKGINVGGNCSGIPTLSGFIKFDDRFRGKPMVFAGTIGLIPRTIKGKPSHQKSARVGDYIVMVGGRVGLDGVNGATFSSLAIDSSSLATAVQIGDPITQKKMSDVLVKEARDRGLYNSITDNGAGGLSSSVGEMAKECGGAEVDLEKVPLKYLGVRPWEIWISESQERMTLAVPPKNWKKFKELMDRRGVEATIIGKFTNSGKIVCKWDGKEIMNMDMEFLHNGLPKKNLKTKKPNSEKLKLQILSSPAKTLEKLLSDPNISGFSFISEQYDHEVQASSVLKPLSGPGRINTDAQVFSPVLSSKKGVVISSALYPEYSETDPYNMAAASLDTAVRNTIVAGGKLNHLAILDNTCWCSSDEPERLWQLKESIRACYDAAVAYGTPFISGKDSMFNDFSGYDEKGNPIKISIPPTLLISTISVMPDIYKTVSPEFKNTGDLIYLLGETKDELGKVPKVDLNKNLKTYQVLEKAIDQELISSAISLTSGGLGIALAKAAVGGMLGCEVNIQNISLFSESQGRILVSVSPKNQKAFEKLVKNISDTNLGKVAKDKKFIVTDGKSKIISTDVNKLHKIYHKFSNSMK